MIGRGPRVFLVLTLLLGVAGKLAAADAVLTPSESEERSVMSERLDPAYFDPAVMSAAIFEATNRVRRRLGLPLFTPLKKLDRAADIKADAGVLEPGLSHTSALPLHATVAERVKAAGLPPFQEVAENLARLSAYDVPETMKQFGVRTRGGREEFYRLDTGETLKFMTYAQFAERVVNAWMNSPGHRANLVNPALVSLGCAARPCRSSDGSQEQIYAVQVFYTPLKK